MSDLAMYDRNKVFLEMKAWRERDQPAEAALAVALELVQRYYQGHELRAKVDDAAGKAVCDCANCETARPLIARLPK